MCCVQCSDVHAREADAHTCIIWKQIKYEDKSLDIYYNVCRCVMKWYLEYDSFAVIVVKLTFGRLGSRRRRRRLTRIVSRYRLGTIFVAAVYCQSEANHERYRLASAEMHRVFRNFVCVSFVRIFVWCYEWVTSRQSVPCRLCSPAPLPVDLPFVMCCLPKHLLEREIATDTCLFSKCSDL